MMCLQQVVVHTRNVTHARIPCSKNVKRASNLRVRVTPSTPPYPEATFDEQQAVMEEMFGQIETLTQIRAQLEEQLATAQKVSQCGRKRPKGGERGKWGEKETRERR